MIPVIPKADKADIKAGFQFAVLTEIKGKRSYKKNERSNKTDGAECARS